MNQYTVCATYKLKVAKVFLITKLHLQLNDWQSIHSELIKCKLYYSCLSFSKYLWISKHCLHSQQANNVFVAGITIVIKFWFGPQYWTRITQRFIHLKVRRQLDAYCTSGTGYTCHTTNAGLLVMRTPIPNWLNNTHT